MSAPLLGDKNCLVDYYESVLEMVGAGGLPVATTFKRKFKSISNEDDPSEGAAPTDADAAPAPGAGTAPAAEASAKRGRGCFSVTELLLYVCPVENVLGRVPLIPCYLHS